MLSFDKNVRKALLGHTSRFILTAVKAALAVRSFLTIRYARTLLDDLDKPAKQLTTSLAPSCSQNKNVLLVIKASHG